MTEPFATALDVEAIRALYRPPKPSAIEKDVGVLNEMAITLLEASPLVFLATYGSSGACDVSPRGGPPGFVRVLDGRYLVIPDATGNRRLDSLTNIAETGRAAILSIIPGRSGTLRAAGRACVTTDAALLAVAGSVGRPPASAIVLDPEELYTHCPKAFVRSGVWTPETWPPDDQLPTMGEVGLAFTTNPDETLESIEREQRESLLHRLE
jgi:PPOX class probable FMN-dependent enzyme